MTNVQQKTDDDKEYRDVDTAMKRARKIARERAKQAGHGVLIYRDGKILELPVDYSTRRDAVDENSLE